MPFTANEIAEAGKTSLDFYVRNNPIDQIDVQRPFLKVMMAKSKTFPGAKENIVEQLRYTYGSNFQWYYGASSVSYNARNTIEQAMYPWTSAHDGYFIDEDHMTQNGIILTDDTKGKKASRAEVMQLNNLFNEHNEVLRLGFEQSFSRDLHRDGTSASDAIEGLDHLLEQAAPASQSGTAGGIDRSTAGNEYWRNNAPGAGIAQSALVTTIEQQWRACARNGGAPDFIMAGSNFIDDLRDAIRAGGSYQLNQNNQADVYDAVMHRQGVDSGLRIHGIPVLWAPEFSELDTLDSPSNPWEDRCYMLNTKHMRLRPAEGHNMISRNPPRVYNKYVHYWALTWKGGLCLNRSNAHSVMYID